MSKDTDVNLTLKSSQVKLLIELLNDALDSPATRIDSSYAERLDGTWNVICYQVPEELLHEIEDFSL